MISDVDASPLHPVVRPRFDPPLSVTRAWDMPNANTFKIPTVARIVADLVGDGRGWADPFANANSPAEFTNDINPSMPTTHHLDAVAFLESFADRSLAGVLLDPPYSLHQINEVYEGYGNMKTISRVYAEAARVCAVGGFVATFGWNSNGIGKRGAFRMEAVWLIAHGGSHNDTIVTVQRKMCHQLDLFAA